MNQAETQKAAPQKEWRRQLRNHVSLTIPQKFEHSKSLGFNPTLEQQGKALKYVSTKLQRSPPRNSTEERLPAELTLQPKQLHPIRRNQTDLTNDADITHLDFGRYQPSAKCEVAERTLVIKRRYKNKSLDDCKKRPDSTELLTQELEMALPELFGSMTQKPHQGIQ